MLFDFCNLSSLYLGYRLRYNLAFYDIINIYNLNHAQR